MPGFHTQKRSKAAGLNHLGDWICGQGKDDDHKAQWWRSWEQKLQRGEQSRGNERREWEGGDWLCLHSTKSHSNWFKPKGSFIARWKAYFRESKRVAIIGRRTEPRTGELSRTSCCPLCLCPSLKSAAPPSLPLPPRCFICSLIYADSCPHSH